MAFSLRAPGAERVELVAEFTGWHEERRPMHRGPEGRWALSVPVGPGVHRFRYLIDGDRWILDDDAHGRCVAADGTVWSRLYRPPLQLDPDAIAA